MLFRLQQYQSPENQKSVCVVCAMILAIVNDSHDSHDDRFVLIGLCWMYGRSEFPPPTPRHLRRSTFCTPRAVGDERHCLFDCPHLVIFGLNLRR